MLAGLLKRILSLFYRQPVVSPELYSLIEGIKRGGYGPAGYGQDDAVIQLAERVGRLEGEKAPSPKKKRVKERVRRALRQHEKLTADQLSVVIGLSRTRCNEYLKELERDGLVTWFDEGKKRYYRLLEEGPVPAEA